jgi:cobalt/nickel transport system permease protein
LDESRVPLMGVMGAFVFAAQMINFPVGAGSSGHLVGGALLVAALGPSAAMVVMTAILVLQALIFQDGGLLALGANVFNMALAGVLSAWLAWRGFSRWRTPGLVLAGFVSVFVSAMLCLGELALSGVRLPPGTMGLAVGVFAVTGVLEGLITAAVVGGLERMNPDWLRTSKNTGGPALAALFTAALVLAAGGFAVASSLPDGLERMAGLAGITSQEINLFQAPLADYDAAVAAAPWVRKALAGLAGLGLALAFTWLAARLLKRPRRV